MTDFHSLAGVYAAAVTPIEQNASSLDLDSVSALLHFLHSRGSHGVLLFGTTGEGPSFSPKEREAYLRAVQKIRKELNGFKILVGTGTPSLSETIELTNLAFDLGSDGVVVLPPYYFRKVSDDGLFRWFSELIDHAVPKDKFLLGYHIPPMTGIGFSLDLLEKLKDKYPTQFAGIKDSSHDEAFATAVGQKFGRDLLVLNGTDTYLHHALKNNAQGAITAPANLISDNLRKLFDLYQEGKDPSEIQNKVNEQRHFLEKFAPIAPILKGLLSKIHGLPQWSVRSPLEDASQNVIEEAAQEFLKI